MKRIIIFIVAAVTGAGFWSCNSDKLDSESIFVDPTIEKTDFDRYLYREYVLPYNIDVMYRFKSTEVDIAYQVTPSTIEASKIMAVLMKHLWLDVYSEASSDGIDFVKMAAVRNILFVGSAAYEPDNSMVMGEAAGGKKIIMYSTNKLVEDEEAMLPIRLLWPGGEDPVTGEYRITGDFHVIHHEFGHIMHQMKHYPQTFKQITSGSYVSGQWVNKNLQDALDAGFVTPYGMSAYDEDFVEIFSTYICSTPEEWEARLAKAAPTAPEITDKGRNAIEAKLAIIKSYVKNSWQMDLDNVRDIILRRANELDKLDFVNLK